MKRIKHDGTDKELTTINQHLEAMKNSKKSENRSTFLKQRREVLMEKKIK